MTQSLMIILDDAHSQGFINSKEKDMIITNHAYFEKVNMSVTRDLPLSFKKFKLGLVEKV